MTEEARSCKIKGISTNCQ